MILCSSTNTPHTRVVTARLWRGQDLVRLSSVNREVWPWRDCDLSTVRSGLRVAGCQLYCTNNDKRTGHGFCSCLCVPFFPFCGKVYVCFTEKQEETRFLFDLLSAVSVQDSCATHPYGGLRFHVCVEHKLTLFGHKRTSFSRLHQSATETALRRSNKNYVSSCFQ